MNKNQAAELLNNPAFGQIMENMLQRYWEEWRNSNSVEDREIIFVKTTVLNDIVSEITAQATFSTGDSR